MTDRPSIPDRAAVTHFGTVAVVGRTNVGKSTFLNAALGEALAIVSPLPQTTRDALLGVVTRGSAQFAFVDTPGLHRPKTELGRRMNSAALEAARGADVIVFMTCVEQRPGARATAASFSAVAPEDARLLAELPSDTTTLLVINKVDTLKNKGALLPLLAAFDELHDFAAMVPASMHDTEHVDRVLEELVRVLPPGPAGYDDDTLTDRSVGFFVREYVREQVLERCRGEVPHAVAVSIDSIAEGRRRLAVRATVHLEKAGQRAIVVGRAGEGIGAVRLGAQARLEQLLGKSVRLQLFVRLTPRWKDMPRQLAELGYEPLAAGSLRDASPAQADTATRGADVMLDEPPSAAAPTPGEPAARAAARAQEPAPPATSDDPAKGSTTSDTSEGRPLHRPRRRRPTRQKPTRPHPTHPPDGPRTPAAQPPPPGPERHARGARTPNPRQAARQPAPRAAEHRTRGAGARPPRTGSSQPAHPSAGRAVRSASRQSGPGAATQGSRGATQGSRGAKRGARGAVEEAPTNAPHGAAQGDRRSRRGRRPRSAP